MSLGLLSLIALAIGGGLLILHGAGRTKQESEAMLEEYRRLLTEARRTKRKPPAAEEEPQETLKP